MKPLWTVAALALCTAGCRGEAPAVARLAVEPRQVRLAYPEVVELRLTWEPRTDLAGRRPLVFVHLRDSAGGIVHTYDHPLPASWQEGSPIIDPLRLYQSALAPPLPAGSYQLSAGLYEAGKGERWPLEGVGADLGRHEYLVATVAVPAPAADRPRFAFSPAWQAPEAGQDSQVLARRRLVGGAGSISAEGLASPGTLWLEMEIPAAGAGETLEIEDSSGTPSAAVSWSCGGMETSISGVGSHGIELTAEEAPPGGTCDIEVRTNFRLQASDGKRSKPPRSIALAGLAWAPGPGG